MEPKPATLSPGLISGWPPTPNIRPPGVWVSERQACRMTISHSIRLAARSSPHIACPMFVPHALSREECQAIVVEGGVGWEPTKITKAGYERPGVTVGAVSNPAVRSADHAELGPEGSVPVADRVLDLAIQANEREFGFTLTGMLPNDAMSILRYDHRASGHFSIHQDLGASFSTRKLSLSVQLSEDSAYEGGDLVFPYANDRGPRSIGTLAIFPSYLPHYVTTVTSGRRYALVGWIHGPAFR